MKLPINPQNRLSREWMQIAILKLLQKKDLADITVSELTAMAGVARVTFYRNYTDLSDVLFDYLEMSDFGLAKADEQKKLYLPYFIRNYFDFFKEHQVLLNCIYRNNMSGRLSDLLKKQLNTNIYRMLSAYGFESHYEVSALVGILQGILNDWFRDGMAESTEAMTMIVYNIITKFSCIADQF